MFKFAPQARKGNINIPASPIAIKLKCAMEGKMPERPSKIKDALAGTCPAPQKRIPKARGVKQNPRANADIAGLLPSTMLTQSLIPASRPPEKKKYRNECNRSILSLDSLFYPAHAAGTDIDPLSRAVL